MEKRIQIPKRPGYFDAQNILHPLFQTGNAYSITYCEETGLHSLFTIASQSNKLWSQGHHMSLYIKKPATTMIDDIHLVFKQLQGCVVKRFSVASTDFIWD